MKLFNCYKYMVAVNIPATVSAASVDSSAIQLSEWSLYDGLWQCTCHLTIYESFLLWSIQLYLQGHTQCKAMSCLTHSTSAQRHCVIIIQNLCDQPLIICLWSREAAIPYWHVALLFHEQVSPLILLHSSMSGSVSLPLTYLCHNIGNVSILGWGHLNHHCCCVIKSIAAWLIAIWRGWHTLHVCLLRAIVHKVDVLWSFARNPLVI